MIRDWHQCWDVNAEFVFLRPMRKLLDRDYTVGDVMPPEVRQHLGPNNLLAWWKAGVIAIKDGYGSPKTNEPASPEHTTPTPSASAEGTRSEEVLVPEPTSTPAVAIAETGSVTPPKRKRGRPRKNPLPEV